MVVPRITGGQMMPAAYRITLSRVHGLDGPDESEEIMAYYDVGESPPAYDLMGCGGDAEYLVDDLRFRIEDDSQ